MGTWGTLGWVTKRWQEGKGGRFLEGLKARVEKGVEQEEKCLNCDLFDFYDFCDLEKMKLYFDCAQQTMGLWGHWGVMI